MVLLRLFMIAVLTFASMPAHAQMSAVLNADNSVIASLATVAAHVTLEPGCSEVLSAQSPFQVVRPVGGREGLKTDFDGGRRGILPANSIVEFTGTNVIDSKSAANYVGVKILSVPKGDKTAVVIGAAKARGDIGEASVISLVGQKGYVNRSDLVPYTPGVLTTATELAGFTPGIKNAESTVFVVRQPTGLYNGPTDLPGRAVRLARSSEGAYKMKRCCPGGVPAGSWKDSVTGYARDVAHNVSGGYVNGSNVEASRVPGCNYTPVYELLSSSGTTSNPHVEKEFTPNCNEFTSLLQPAGQQSITAAINSIAHTSAASDAYLTQIQNLSSTTVNGTLCNNSGKCGTGNHSKSICRAGVQRILTTAGKMPIKWYVPGDNGYAVSWNDGRLEKIGFTRLNLPTPIKVEQNSAIPVGAVIVYSRMSNCRDNPAGHVEIKVSPSMYCSDYCTNHSRETGGCRQAVGVFLPPGT